MKWVCSIKHFFDGYKGICYTGGRNIAVGLYRYRKNAITEELVG